MADRRSVFDWQRQAALSQKLSDRRRERRVRRLEREVVLWCAVALLIGIAALVVVWALTN